MIRFKNLTKGFRTPGGGRKMLLSDVSLTIPSGTSVALLGRNGAGKSTLLQMIGGRISQDDGEIETTGTISWPVGHSGSFHTDMTGAQNTRFIARIYGVDSDELCDFVADFAELGAHFNLPVRTYSSGMKSRLAFGVSVGIPFDTYLVDEVTAVGDASFRAKSKGLFLDRMKTAGAIVVTHSMPEVRQLCRAGIVLNNGQMKYYDDVEEAIAAHIANLGLKKRPAAKVPQDEDEDEDS
ncbi:ABC transporter ATP-binding protein [Falsirhodobacter xinxiangensis]|uniref:ABC transporter ATP-binding protein n=1 Tax=Falsirhodobacter xinxiangensis TaxID=2530049 RepID=UPI0010AAB5F6|nr:ABC transporter ATP-binding protein [Rhodobacter xinxiangensis]